mgnify:CR=1 FL=1
MLAKERNYQQLILFNKNNHKNNINTSLLLKIFITINIISNICTKKSEIIKRKLQSTYSEVTLIISGKDTNQILNNNFKPIPYSLEVNSVSTEFKYIINNLSYQNNNKIVMKWNTIIKSCENMFYGLSNITEIDLSNFDFSEVTTMNGMFSGLSKVSIIKFNSRSKITKNTNLEKIFNGCDLLESIDLSIFDTSLVTNMGHMFHGCYKMKSLNLLNFNTSLVEDMKYMFYGLGLLSSLELSNFDTSLVTDMSNMFNGCYQLTSLNLSNFKTDLVNDINSMFSFCISLTSINLSNFNTFSVKNISNLFNGCNSLKEIDLDNFVTNLVTDMSYMFNGCTSLTTLNLSKFNSSFVTNMEYMFGNCVNLKEINLLNFDTSLTTDMKFMFYECNSMINLYIDNFNTSLVNNIQNMFSGCHSLISLEVSNFTTKRVKNMANVFSDCMTITSLDILNFDTSLVTNMKSMFQGCLKLNNLNLQNFNTSSVKKMNFMFYNCESIKSLNLSNFDTSLVTSMQFMFYGCKNLKFLDISHFNTSLVKDMNSMFFKCNEMTSFDLSHFNTSTTHFMGSMFRSCSKLKYLNFYNYKEKEIINIYDLFWKGTENLSFCIKDTEMKNSPKFFEEINLINHIFQQNVILEKEICIDECFNDKEYQYELNKICYINCPKGSTNYNYSCKPLICDKYYNYDKTECISTIPEGFYVNDTSKGTIDKCHPDCKTCDKKETQNSANCKSCLNSKFLDLGNCLDNCPNNEFFQDPSNTEIQSCYCSQITKCSICSLESLNYSLCISCNNKDGYYQKENDSTNIDIFVNCYKDLELQGYYLDNSIYKECYFTCKECDKYGNETHNNCLECKDNYLFNKENKNCYYDICNYYHYYDSNKNYHCTITEQCISDYNKLIKEKKECTNDCSKDNIYKYEYNNECYSSCPEDTIISSNNNLLCEKIDNHNESEIETEIETIPKNCSLNDYFIGNCVLNNLSLFQQKEFIKYLIQEIESGYFSDIFNKDSKKDLIFKDNKIIFQITSISNQSNNKYNNDLSRIVLNGCEDSLKTKYNINKEKSLILLKIDYFINELNIPIIDYALFNPENYSKLDLSACNNDNISLYLSVDIEEKNSFKYQPSSMYYQDICFQYETELKKDIILSDRKREFNEQYLSLCESNCIFNNYNNITKTVLCDCKIKLKSTVLSFNDNKIDLNKLLSNFEDINIKRQNILKCYNKLFSSEGLKKNIGSYIILSLFLLLNFQICFLQNKKKDLFSNDVNKIIKVKNNNEESYLNPPRKSLQRHSLYYDISKNKMKKPFSRYELKNSKSLNSNSNNNQSLFNSVLNNLKFEKPKYKINKIENNISDAELNSLPYEKAILHDSRTYCQYYTSMLKYKHIIYLSFFSSFDYFSISIYRGIFIISFGLFYLVNCFFFTEATIHDIYIEKKFNLIKHTKNIIFSTIIASVIITIFKLIFVPKKNLSEINQKLYEEGKDKIKRELKCLKYKVGTIFLLMDIFLAFCWYCVSIFSVVYKYSQVHLIKAILISYALFLLYPLIFYLIPGIFRIHSLSSNKNYSECIYKFSKIIQWL